MKKLEIDNDIIIIGTEGKNTLGIMREFGQLGKIPLVILLQKELQKKYMVTSSKFAKRIKIYKITDKTEKELINFLKKEYKSSQYKPIVITTTDTACEWIDRHVDELKDNFILSNIDNRSNGINEYLDKYKSFKSLKSKGALVAESYVVDLTKEVDDKVLKKYPIPCILKPRESAHGNKRDIEVCKNFTQLKNGINKFIKLEYKEVLLQEYLDYDFEFSMHGYVTPNDVFVPGVLKYLHKQSIGTNDYAYMEYIPLDEFEAKDAVYDYYKLIRKVGFTGPYAAEAFYRNGKVYINEINFRTDDCSYNEVPSGHYVLPEYALSLLGKDPSVIRDVKKNKRYKIVLTFTLLQLFKNKKIGFFRMIKEILSAKSFHFIAKGDIKPLLIKFNRNYKKGE